MPAGCAIFMPRNHNSLIRLDIGDGALRKSDKKRQKATRIDDPKQGQTSAGWFVSISRRAWHQETPDSPMCLPVRLAWDPQAMSDHVTL